MICVTGRSGGGRAALNWGKRAIVAGPGNPPVVVDETADLDRAARCIIQGGCLRQQPAVHRAKKKSSSSSRVFDRMMAGDGASRRRAAERSGRSTG